MIRRIIFSLCIFIFILCATTPIAAQSSGAVVRMDPPLFSVGLNQVEIIRIVIENAQDVYGIDVRAKFDPTVIEIQDANPAQDGVQMIPGDFIKPDFLVRNVVDNQKGTLQYVITQVNPTPAVSGNGIVLTILIRGKIQGKQTALTIDFVEIADRRGRKLAARPQSSTVAVVAPKPATPTTVPTASASPTPAPIARVEPIATVMDEPEDAPAPRPASQNNLFFDLALVAIACAGFGGAFAVIALVAFILFRRARAIQSASNFFQME